MPLEFLGDAGVYLPSHDGIKFTAIADGHPREYIVSRAALIAAGATPTMDPASLLGFFEQRRDIFHAAAANTATSGAIHIIGVEHVARARLATYVAKPGRLLSGTVDRAGRVRPCR